MNTRLTPEVTDRTRPAGAKQGELEFRALMNAAVDAVIVIDHLGKVEEFSLAAERMFGYRPDEVAGARSYHAVISLAWPLGPRRSRAAAQVRSGEAAISLHLPGGAGGGGAAQVLVEV